MSTAVKGFKVVSSRRSVNHDDFGAGDDRGRLPFPCFFRVRQTMLLVRHAVVLGNVSWNEMDYNIPHRRMQEAMLTFKTMEDCPI